MVGRRGLGGFDDVSMEEAFDEDRDITGLLSSGEDRRESSIELRGMGSLSLVVEVGCVAAGRGVRSASFIVILAALQCN